MHGLCQAGKMTNNQLIVALTPFGYCPVLLTAGLLQHDTRDTTFCLAVDNFGVKYTNKDDADHLLATLQACNSTSLVLSGLVVDTVAYLYTSITYYIYMPGCIT
jgi:hypothetical protein